MTLPSNENKGYLQDYSVISFPLLKILGSLKLGIGASSLKWVSVQGG